MSGEAQLRGTEDNVDMLLRHARVKRPLTADDESDWLGESNPAT